MQLAAVSKPHLNSEIFWNTQLAGLDLRGQSLQIWQNESLLFAHGTPEQNLEFETDIRFEDALIGKLCASSNFRAAWSANPDSHERVAAFLNWTESGLEARLQVLNLLHEIQSLSPSFNWVGIYRLNPKNPEELLVSAFLGDATPHRRIPIDHGICGAAIREGATLNIANVQEDSRYLSCSLETKSELVVPLRNSQSEIVAELDIDCSVLDGFSGAIETQIHRICQRMEKIPDLFPFKAKKSKSGSRSPEASSSLN